MKSSIVILMLVTASGPALAKLVPQSAHAPRAKVTAQSTPAPKREKPELITDEALKSGPSACMTMLREIADFTPQPDRAGPGECGGSDLVQLDAIKMPDGSRVAVTPAPMLRCKMAESVAEWMRSDMGPAVSSELAKPVKALVTASGYHCRPRNGVKGAKISEHGRGNAMDITGFKLAGGEVVDLTRPAVSKLLRDKARVSTCGRFTTVLGPGSDAYHESHIHVDLAERSRGHRMCQWDVRETAPVVANATPALPRWPVGVAKASSEAANANASASLVSVTPSPATADANASAKLISRPAAASEPAPETADVPLPLRRPFELVYASPRHSTRYR
jgi:hypothetical protein